MVAADNIQDLLKEYPYLKDIAQTHLLLTKQDYKNYEQDSQLKYGLAKTISINLFQELFLNSEYYYYVEKLFKDEIPLLIIAYVSNGDTMGRIEFTKTELLTNLKKIIDQTPNQELTSKYQLLANEISFDKYQKLVADQEVTYEIEGATYTFKVADFLTFLNLDNFDFVRVCLDKEITTIKGIDKKYFFYALSKYITPETFNNYLFPIKFVTHYQDLTSYSLVDYQAVNLMRTTKDPNFAKVVVNPLLHDYILKNMDPNFTPLEKAIYIYIKLCKTLTYDEEFYANLQQGKVVAKHEDANHVKTISPENNKVVCYEFTAIYGQFLAELGINYKVNQTFAEKFGGGHALLYFRFQEYLVSADAVVTILQGDIAEAKFNHPLKGLNSNNRSPQTREQFKKTFERIYKILAVQEQKELKYPFLEEETFADIIADYYPKAINLNSFSLTERLEILLLKLQESHFSGIDQLSYLLNLKKMLFTEEELASFIRFTIIGVSANPDEVPYQTGVIISINENGFHENPDANLYYFYNQQGIKKISREAIIKNMSLNIYRYLNSIDVIPGLNYRQRK